MRSFEIICFLMREPLQDSSLIRKLRTVLTNRILRQAQPLASNNEEDFENICI
jgi:hypothetical protein